jgi:hypothetical protein
MTLMIGAELIYIEKRGHWQEGISELISGAMDTNILKHARTKNEQKTTGKGDGCARHQMVAPC